MGGKNAPKLVEAAGPISEKDEQRAGPMNIQLGCMVC